MVGIEEDITVKWFYFFNARYATIPNIFPTMLPLLWLANNTIYFLLNIFNCRA
jgi:hypothetical protein